mmetsp:Transcript_9456/g.24519  ORF Transcript_9456/g.24519 Transcript_9456/m.24519 type:complete len:319 (-) Transcript_9456:114-1070(-)
MASSRSMGRTASTVGMMEGAFFVSRSDLLQWVNRLLQLNLTKVEQCASGAVYCQVLDACHPSTVSMRKVNWMAKADHEFIPNYKVLQAAFDKNCIEKHIDVDKLIRAKYQDNLEFLQWMKCYWEREGSGRQDYAPVQAREGKPVPTWARAATGTLTGGEKENQRPRVARPVESDTIKKAAVSSSNSRPVSAKPAAAVASARPKAASTSLNASMEYDEGRGQSGEVAELKAQVLSQQEDLQELRSTLDGLERERDYYFRKLRDVEILCTTLQAHMPEELTAAKLVADVQGILYAENDDQQEEGVVMAEPGEELAVQPVC